HGAFVDVDVALARDADQKRLTGQRLGTLRLRLVDVHAYLAGEAAGEHEEHDEKEQHVDHVDQVDFRRAAHAPLEAELVRAAHGAASPAVVARNAPGGRV